MSRVKKQQAALETAANTAGCPPLGRSPKGHRPDKKSQSHTRVFLPCTRSYLRQLLHVGCFLDETRLPLPAAVVRVVGAAGHRQPVAVGVMASELLLDVARDIRYLDGMEEVKCCSFTGTMVAMQRAENRTANANSTDR